MPVVFADTGDEEEVEEEELEEEHTEDERETGFTGLFRHPQDSVDEGDFTEEREQRLIVSLTRDHDNPILWQAQCIALWRQICDAAAEMNAENPG